MAFQNHLKLSIALLFLVDEAYFAISALFFFIYLCIFYLWFPWIQDGMVVEDRSLCGVDMKAMTSYSSMQKRANLAHLKQRS